MDTTKIQEMIDLLNDNDLSVLEIEEDNKKIRIEKNKYINNATIEHSVNNKIEETNNINNDNLNTIKAPLVGMLYLKPSPNDPNFVNVGDHVKKGDVICIIEAMKVMNEIKANQDGIIKDILKDNESLVEYDEPLFVIE